MSSPLAVASLAGDCPSILAISTNVIELLGLRDAFLGPPGTIVSAATVTARVLEPDPPHDPIGGIPDPITLVPDGGGNPGGNYRGTIPSAASVTPGDRFRAVITAVDAGSTLTVTFEGLVVE